jgi:protein-S-isoprenylcysteine O-methyltransferase Ste14
MRDFLLIVLLASSANSFSFNTNQKILVSHKMSSSGIEENIGKDKVSFSKTDLPKMDNLELPKLDDLDLPNFDDLKSSFESSLSNMSDGTIEDDEKGYVFAQLMILSCIIGGGVPLIGEALQSIAGPGLMATGIAFAVGSLLELGSENEITPWAQPSKDATLVKSGVYQYVRHPFHSGLISFAVGLSIYTHSAPRLILAFALYMVLNAYSDYEEIELEHNLKGYTTYKENLVKEKFFPSALFDDLKKKVEEASDEILSP